jgi:hypothetical protein
LLNQQARDLMGRLFHSARQLVVTPMPPGLSGSAVLEAKPIWGTGGLGQSVVVKIGRREKIEREKQNYDLHVKNFLPLNHATQLKHEHSRHLGALEYTLAHTHAADTTSLAAFYRSHSADEIDGALKHLFGQTCALWYKNHTEIELGNLRDLYLSAFDLDDQPNRLGDEIGAMRPGVDSFLSKLTFEAPGLALPNPRRWLADEGASVLPMRRCITHGDLHAGNILINDGQCWLIDFYRTYPSHLLRDFVVLETDIKFRLARAISMEEFYQLERALVLLENPDPGVDVIPGATGELRKVAQVVAGLRATAWAHLGWPPRQNQQEYLVSLLMATLNVLRLRHFKEDPDLQPQRERALLSAGLICQQLQQPGLRG